MSTLGPQVVSQFSFPSFILHESLQMLRYGAQFIICVGSFGPIYALYLWLVSQLVWSE